MDKARVYVDLNEMVTDDIVLLSKDDTTLDSMGSIITFCEGLPVLHKFLICFKNHGMDKDSMLKNLEKIKNQCDFKAKDVLMDLMDFAVGWCSQDL